MFTGTHKAVLLRLIVCQKHVYLSYAATQLSVERDKRNMKFSTVCKQPGLFFHCNSVSSHTYVQLKNQPLAETWTPELRSNAVVAGALVKAE